MHNNLHIVHKVTYSTCSHVHLDETNILSSQFTIMTEREHLYEYGTKHIQIDFSYAGDCDISFVLQRIRGGIKDLQVRNQFVCTGGPSRIDWLH